MMKKSSLIIGALTLTAVALVGCQKGGEEEAGSTKWTPPKPDKKAEAPAAAKPATPPAPPAAAPNSAPASDPASAEGGE